MSPIHLIIFLEIPEKFLHLTGTRWTALGVALSASFGGITLWLRKRSHSERPAHEVELTLITLRESGNICRKWLKWLHVNPAEGVSLIPDNWPSLMAFAKRQPRKFRKAAQLLDLDLRALEPRLRSYADLTLAERRVPNPESDSITEQLQTCIRITTDLSDQLRKCS